MDNSKPERQEAAGLPPMLSPTLPSLSSLPSVNLPPTTSPIPSPFRSPTPPSRVHVPAPASPSCKGQLISKPEAGENTSRKRKAGGDFENSLAKKREVSSFIHSLF